MATMTTEPDDDDLLAIAAEQRRELMASEALDSDHDLAFQLQMQEAITASLSLHPSSSSSSSSTSPPQLPPNDDVLTFSALQSQELERFELERRDRQFTETEFKRIRDDLHRRIHDRSVAAEIHRMSEDEWQVCGDNFERPFGEGTSSSSPKGGGNAVFRVYFKGLVSEEERVRDSKVVLVGIGVAICDARDDLIFELRKPVFGNGRSRQAAEGKALIEGLNAAIALDLKRVVFYTDCFPLYKFVTGQWLPRQRKIATLFSQVKLLQNKFMYSAPSLVARNDFKFAFKFAREAIVSQVNRPSESTCTQNMYESCVICLEDTDVGQIFSIDDCLHRYCFSCMKQHVEVKLLHAMVPKCPHEGCNSELKIESCGKFLTPKLIEIMNQRIKEASIPVTEKVYCPYPKCSALMSKSDVLKYSKVTLDISERSGIRKCTKCQHLFCINCKVPWHINMSCLDYKRKNPYPPAEDAKLKTLADRNLWRQCVKCNHMIELAAGCYHMTCRCGYEFCYTCGAEWKNKKATCSCPLWDEDRILDYELDSDEEEDYDDDFYDSESDDYY